MPPKKKGALARKKKKVGSGGGNKRKIVPAPSNEKTVESASEPEQVTPQANPDPIIYKDPWQKIKSPYGGKLSPSDSWSRLSTGYKEKSLVSLLKGDFVDIDGKTHGVIDSVVLERKRANNVKLEKGVEEIKIESMQVTLDVGEVSETTAISETTVISETPPTMDSLAILNCDFTSVAIAPAVLSTLVSLNLSSSSLDTSAVDLLLNNDGNPVFLRSVLSKRWRRSVMYTQLTHTLNNRELVLTDNILKSLPTKLPIKLVKLDVSYNKITAIDPSSFEFCQICLYSLNLESNHLTSVFSR